jgi:hypothetical protein
MLCAALLPAPPFTMIMATQLRSFCGVGENDGDGFLSALPIASARQDSAGLLFQTEQMLQMLLAFVTARYLDCTGRSTLLARNPPIGIWCPAGSLRKNRNASDDSQINHR